MTTFEGIVYAILPGLSEFLPVGAQAHQLIASDLFGLAKPGDAAMGALHLGAFLAVFIAFRHDWASMISSLLQVVIYRRVPMTLDERMPFFVALSLLLAGAGWYYLHPKLDPFVASPLGAALGILGGAFLIGLGERLSRRTKDTYDWNLVDAVLVGLGLLLLLIPGGGWLTGALVIGRLRNYRAEAAAKYAFFCSAPLLAASAVHRLHGMDWRGSAPSVDLNWITFGVMTVVTLFFGVLTINGFMRHVQRRTLGPYGWYRLTAGIALLGWLQLRHHL
jgi:undecaprenyl-diphosphatase